MSESGKKKPQYEKPQLLDLNDWGASYVDANCVFGSKVSGQGCHNGTYANPCHTGTHANANQCAKGGVASRYCAPGTTPGLRRCVTGGRP